MDFKRILSLNKSMMIFRAIVLIIGTILGLLMVFLITPSNPLKLIPFSDYLKQSLFFVLWVYIPLEAGSIFIKIFVSIRSKWKNYFGFAYITVFIILALYKLVDNGKYDRIFYIGAFTFIIILLGLIIEKISDR